MKNTYLLSCGGPVYRRRDSLGSPLKVNADSGGKPNGIPLEVEQQSERRDAGLLIVKEVFGIVK